MAAFRRESWFILRRRNRLGPGECEYSDTYALKEQPNSGRLVLPVSRIGDQVLDTLAGRFDEHQDLPPKILIRF
jgi:hypothetical protein